MFWNKNVNKSDLNLEKGNDDKINDGDLEKEHFKIKREASLEVLK